MHTQLIPQLSGTTPQIRSCNQLLKPEPKTGNNRFVEIVNSDKQIPPGSAPADAPPTNSTMVNSNLKDIPVQPIKIDTSDGKTLYFQTKSRFCQLNSESSISDFEEYIPKGKSHAVFFDFDNTLKGRVTVGEPIQLRGGNDKDQIEKLNKIKESKWCKGFYIITAGASKYTQLKDVTCREINNLNITHLFKSAKETYPEQRTEARIDNIIGSKNKSDALKQVLREDFAETPPEYVIFIDDSYDNAVDVFLGISYIPDKAPPCNTNVISIHFLSKQKGETNHFKPWFEPIRKQIKEQQECCTPSSSDKAEANYTIDQRHK